MGIYNVFMDKSNVVNEKKLSVIIPLYNVEAHVHKAAESIAKQAFDALEVVLVDDGSTDNSLETCASYLSNVDLVSIKQENKGPGGARNTGIQAASGEYILFLDGDDFLLPDAFKSIMEMLEREQPDILFGRYYRWLEQKGLLKAKGYSFSPPTDPLKRTEYILGELPEPSWNVWRYVCRRELIIENGILFDDKILHEDIKWVLELLTAVENISGKISFLQEPFYAYHYRRAGSIMNSRATERLVQLNYNVGGLLSRFQERPRICKALVWQSFYYINEYCSLERDDREKVFSGYIKVLPYYALSETKMLRIAGRMKNPVLFYMLSIVLFSVKQLRRAIIGRKAHGQK